MVKAVLFDFHNTLVISDGWLSLEIHTLPRHVLHRLHKMGLAPYSPELADRAEEMYREVRLEVHRTGQEVDAVTGVNTALKFMNLSVSPEVVGNIIEGLQRECLDGIELQAGAVELLNSLRDMGMTMGVVSNAAYGAFVHWGLRKLKLRDYFQTVLTSDSSGYYKSRPEIFWEALRELGHTPSEAVHIGDSYKFDIIGAKKAGLRAIYLDVGRNEEMPDVQPDAIVRTLPEVLPIIEEWNGN
jgi:HAD superfamily hydrolase (TIGR01549 family)